MEKFIPYEKLSKKEKRSRDLSRRNTWGQLNPVTRKPRNSKAYCRSKARNWKRDAHEPIPGWYFISANLPCQTSSVWEAAASAWMSGNWDSTGSSGIPLILRFT